MKNKNCQITIGNYYERFRDSQKTESKNATKTFAGTSTQVQLLDRIAAEQGVSTSKLIGDLVGDQLELMPHRQTIHELAPHLEKIERHKEVILSLLNSLS